MLKQAVIRGIVTGPRKMIEDMNEALELLQIRPVIETVYPFSERLLLMLTLRVAHLGRLLSSREFVAPSDEQVADAFACKLPSHVLKDAFWCQHTARAAAARNASIATAMARRRVFPSRQTAKT
jgi:hypothetical protein